VSIFSVTDTILSFPESRSDYRGIQDFSKSYLDSPIIFAKSKNSGNDGYLTSYQTKVFA
jgi:hypothetical protein